MDIQDPYYVYYDNKRYQITPAKIYETKNGLTISVQQFFKDTGFLQCLDHDRGLIEIIKIDEIVFEEDDIKDVPYIKNEKTNYKKVEIRKLEQTLINDTSIKVNVLWYDSKTQKLVCNNPDGTRTQYDPFEEFVGFSNFVEKIPTQKFYPSVKYRYNDTEINAMVFREHENTKIELDGKLEDGYVIGNNHEKTKLLFQLQKCGSAILVKLDELENCDEIKKLAEEHYESKKSSNSKNIIDYDNDKTSSSTKSNESSSSAKKSIESDDKNNLIENDKTSSSTKSNESSSSAKNSTENNLIPKFANLDIKGSSSTNISLRNSDNSSDYSTESYSDTKGQNAGIPPNDFLKFKELELSIKEEEAKQKKYEYQAKEYEYKAKVCEKRILKYHIEISELQGQNQNQNFLYYN